MIKQYLQKIHFKNITDKDINLDEGNITFEDASFNPENFHEEDGYSTHFITEDYISFYLKDLDDTITIIVDVSYTFDEEYDSGDYYTPPTTYTTDEVLEVFITRIEMENNESEFTPKLKDKLCEFVESYIESKI